MNTQSVTVSFGPDKYALLDHLQEQVDRLSAQLFQKYPAWCEHMLAEHGDFVCQWVPMYVSRWEKYMAVTVVGQWDDVALHEEIWSQLYKASQQNNQSPAPNHLVETFCEAINSTFWRSMDQQEREAFVYDAILALEAKHTKMVLLSATTDTASERLVVRKKI